MIFVGVTLSDQAVDFHDMPLEPCLIWTHLPVVAGLNQRGEHGTFEMQATLMQLKEHFMKVATLKMCSSCESNFSRKPENIMVHLRNI
jgi:hypothetical protein